MNACTALILHPKATPRPVTSIHPQSASIERHGVTIGEYTVRRYHGHFGSGSFVFDGDDYLLRTDIKDHAQRSPEAQRRMDRRRSGRTRLSPRPHA